MKNLFIFGLSGKMGKAICALNNEVKQFNVTGGFDIVPDASIPTFSKVEDVNVPLDVIIDFSRPETLDSVISLARKSRVPCVIATTGLDDKAVNKIKELSKEIPVFMSGNMSVGINVLIELSKRAALSLPSFDIEILEAHHNQKVDAPSGTAKMIASALISTRENAKIVCGRYGDSCKREKNEIGISAIRGGTVVGEHDVMLFGNDEAIKITHTASSRKIFAEGALRAAVYLTTKKAGLYNMSDMLNNR